VATDLDTRWLDEIRHPNLTVVRHDIVVDDLAPLGTFDVIHVRFLLHHLGPQRAALTVERLHGLLRPGGRLLVEETIGDNRADPGHPSSAANVADADAFLGHVGQFGFDIDIGLQLPRLFTAAGFVDVDNEITNKVRHGGDAFSRFLEVSMRSTMGAIPSDDLYTDGVAGALERFADESLHYISFQQIAIWGTRSDAQRG
jgi:SAM-dependent methyltransferase